MSIVEICLLALGLAMDAFAVAICNGLSMPELRKRQVVLIAFSFGFAQFAMPVIGWYLGRSVYWLIMGVDHWIAFGLLAFIGGSMIWEARKCEKISCRVFKGKDIFLQAVATSIDALAVGTGLAAVSVNIWGAASAIGVITFVLSIVGVLVGKRFGVKLEQKAKVLGGIILFGIGTKILIEHLFFAAAA